MWVILGNSKRSEIIHLLYRKLSLSHVRGSILCQSVSLDWKTELLLFTASLEIGCHPSRPPWPQSPGFCVICKNNFSSSFNSCKHSSCPFWVLLVCRWIYGGVIKRPNTCSSKPTWYVGMKNTWIECWLYSRLCSVMFIYIPSFTSGNNTWGDVLVTWILHKVNKGRSSS